MSLLNSYYIIFRRFRFHVKDIIYLFGDRVLVCLDFSNVPSHTHTYIGDVANTICRKQSASAFYVITINSIEMSLKYVVFAITFSRF